MYMEKTVSYWRDSRNLGDKKTRKYGAWCLVVSWFLWAEVYPWEMHSSSRRTDLVVSAARRFLGVSVYRLPSAVRNELAFPCALLGLLLGAAYWKVQHPWISNSGKLSNEFCSTSVKFCLSALVSQTWKFFLGLFRGLGLEWLCSFCFVVDFGWSPGKNLEKKQKPCSQVEDSSFPKDSCGANRRCRHGKGTREGRGDAEVKGN